MNESLQNYLNYYVAMSQLEYAVLLDGEWGSGKTFFIKQFMDSFSEKDRKRFLYVSLNGLKHTSEVDDLIFTELHPKLGGKIAKAGGSLVRSVLSVGLRYDLNGLSVSSSNAKTGLNLKDFFRNLKDKILIFDDLERCHISPSELLGYINRFVEHDQIPVICIANEKEIDPKVIIDSNDGENEKNNKHPKSNYVLIKEKVFGKTFRIQNELDEILDSIIQDITEKQEDYPTKFIEQHRYVILSVYKKSGLNNLRLLKNILVDWNQFWKLLDQDVRNKDGLLQELLETFLVLSFLRLSGSFPSESFDTYYDDYINALFVNSSKNLNKVQKSENENDSESIKPIDYLSQFGLYWNQIILGLKIWDDWFRYGTVEKSVLYSKIRESRYFYNESTPVWKKLFSINQLDEQEFDSLYAELKKNWENKSEKSPYVIMHYIGILQILVKQGMITDYALDEVEKYGIQYLEEVFLDSGITQYTYSKVYMGKNGGLGYPDTEEFEPIREKFQELVNGLQDTILEERAKEIIDFIQNDFDKYKDCIYVYNNEKEYQSKPWLIKIKPKIFFDILRVLPTKKIADLSQTLMYRMENHYSIQEDEGPHLFEILNHIEENLDQISHQFRRGLIRRFLLGDLKDFVLKQVKK